MIEPKDFFENNSEFVGKCYDIRETSQADAEERKYLILSDEKTFDLDGTHNVCIAPRGHIIYENPDDEYGYSFASADVFAENFQVVTEAKPITAAQDDDYEEMPPAQRRHPNSGFKM